MPFGEVMHERYTGFTSMLSPIESVKRSESFVLPALTFAPNVGMG